MKNIFFAFVLCLLIQGCASTLLMFKIDPQALNGQEAISQEGVKAVISQKKARVTIQPSANTYSSEDRPSIVVSVYAAKEPFNFSTKDIQVFVDGNPHRVFTYDELVADIKEQERISIAKAEDVKSSQYMEGLGQQATIQFDAKVYSIQNKTIKSLEDINSNYLKDISMLPYNQYGGHVTIEKIPNPTQPHEIKVIVTAAGEGHEFLLNHFKVQ